ncbi:MAG: AlkZ-related protein [Burkholderiales bacterium]
MPKADIPPEIEDYRDQRWHREPTRQVETAFAAERFIEQVGFAACMTDCRRPGPSLYVAVCGRRDAVMPRHVQTDPEASAAWLLKDDLVRRGKVYYGKLAGGRAMFLAPRVIPYFHAVWGLRRAEESRRLSRAAQAILRVLRREWEIASRWLRRRVRRGAAVREIARCFLAAAGMTVPGELARATGLSRPEAGQGNRALVAEGFATSPARGVYVLADPAALGPRRLAGQSAESPGDALP